MFLTFWSLFKFIMKLSNCFLSGWNDGIWRRSQEKRVKGVREGGSERGREGGREGESEQREGESEQREGESEQRERVNRGRERVNRGRERVNRGRERVNRGRERVNRGREGKRNRKKCGSVEGRKEICKWEVNKCRGLRRPW